MTAAAEGLRHPLPPPEPGEARAVADGVLWLRLPLPLRPDHVNVWALEEDDGWTVVDAGMNWRGCREGWAALRAGPLGGRPIRRVVATHHHPDHIGLAGALAAEGAELWTTRTAWLFARMLTLDHQDRPSPQALAFYAGAGWAAERLAAYAAAEPFNFSRVVAPLAPGFRRIADGQTLRLGGRDWRVVTGGGHAPEQAGLWSLDGALAITGDQVLPRISPNIGVYPTEPEADPLADWFAACERLLALAGPDRLALPGHGDAFTGLPFRLRQLAQNHHTALARLRAHLAAAPRTAVECFATLYRREIGDGEFVLATVEAVAHLNHLLARGEAARRMADGAWRWTAA